MYLIQLEGIHGKFFYKDEQPRIVDQVVEHKGRLCIVRMCVKVCAQGFSIK